MHESHLPREPRVQAPPTVLHAFKARNHLAGTERRLISVKAPQWGLSNIQSSMIKSKTPTEQVSPAPLSPFSCSGIGRVSRLFGRCRKTHELEGLRHVLRHDEDGINECYTLQTYPSAQVIHNLSG